MSDAAHLPLLAVDIGNSSTKLALFSATLSPLPEPEWVAVVPTLETLSKDIQAQLPATARWRVASVQRAAERQLATWVNESRPQDDYHRLTHLDLPLQIALPEPEKVGLDRLAAAVAANALRSMDRAAVVVSAGSALTVNLIAPSGEFLGGAILPGFRMSAQALANATDLLPLALLEASDNPPPALGQSTVAAIRSGLFWGALGAVRELIAQYAKDGPAPDVFITGGDVQRFASLVGDQARFVPNLVLMGIALSDRATRREEEQISR